MGLKLDYNIYTFFLNDFFFLKWNYSDLMPSVVQEVFTKNVLMFAWFNNTALLKTFFFLHVYYFSRSKLHIWFKGFSSMNFQILKYVYVDCDLDSFLLKILQFNNKSCHTINSFCFFNKIFGF